MVACLFVRVWMFKGLDVFQLEMSFRSWSSFERQSLRLSRELGFSESREAGCPGCGAQVDFGRRAPKGWRPGELFCGSSRFRVF